jgi:hypothetical protein
MLSDIDYSEKLSVISDKELVRELDENYYELLFLFTLYNSVKNEPFYRTNTIQEFELSFAELRMKISAVKSEILKRDSVLDKFSSSKKKAITLEVKINRELC